MPPQGTGPSPHTPPGTSGSGSSGHPPSPEGQPRLSVSSGDTKRDMLVTLHCKSVTSLTRDIIDDISLTEIGNMTRH